MQRKMIFIITMFIIAWHGYSQEETSVTLEMKDSSLKEIIRELEQQTRYSFIYNESIDTNRKKSVSINNQKFENALKVIFDNTDIDWRIKKDHVTLTLKKTKPATAPQTQKATISGYITDSESSEVLIGANVYDIISGVGTASNEFGFFSLTLPADDAELRISYTGYSTEARKIKLQKDERINIKLSSNVQLAEVVVVGESKESGIKATRMSAIDVPLNILNTTPALLGEADVMKTIQMLPGVQAGTQGSAGVYVRGGGPDENLILLDGIPLYNVDHLLGFFSVFTPEAVKKVTLYKGSFPARFGGRLSSVIDVRTNDGDMYNYHGTIGIGLLSSKLQLEGPIVKGRTSFNISGRRSYLDLMAKPLLKGDLKDIALYFYDVNAKINHKFNDKSRLFLSFYNGKDKYGTYSYFNGGDFISKDKGHLDWGNILFSARWNYIFSPKLFSNTTIAHTNYKFGIESESQSSYPKEQTESFMSGAYNSGIKDWAYNIDFDYYPSTNHHVKFGAGYLYHDFKPEAETVRVKETEHGTTSDSTYQNISNSHIYANEVSVYAEDEFKITPKLHFNAGLHFSLFNVKNTSYTSLQPRLSVRYQINRDVALKASYTKMNQYIHLLSNYNITLPSDLWVPTTDNIKPMRSHQYSIGAYHTGVAGWEFSAETYYKDMRNIIEYKDGATFLGASYNWEEKVEMGKGRSYGLELMAQKTTGKTTGWIAYTIAKSERKFDKSGINMSKWFPYKYDRRHHINVTANHKISDKIDLSASWEFYTGGVFTVSEEMTSYIIPQYATGSGYNYISLNPGGGNYTVSSIRPTEPYVKPVGYIEGRNNYRLPVSHCLNLGINFRKQKKHGERIWSFGIYNAYNAMNPHFVYKTTEYEKSTEGKDEPISVLKKITIFPFIPSFSYTYKF